MKFLNRTFLIAVIMLLVNCVSAADDSKSTANIKPFLAKYFGSDGFVVLNQKLDLKGTEMDLAVNYVDAKRKIFSRGIGFVVKKGVVTPVVYFETNKVLDSNRKSIFDATVTQYKYYGWAFEWPTKMPKKLNYFYLAYWRDGGKHTADSLEFDWNAKTKTFKINNHAKNQE